MPEKQKKGLLIVNTGDGKGKTTASLGMAVRNLGWGRKVSIIQFAKGCWETGELRFMKNNGVSIIPTWGENRWFKKIPAEKQQVLIDNALKLTRELLNDDSIDLLILDEINIMLFNNMITLDEILPLLHKRPEKMTVILTGRNALPEIINAADLVSQVCNIKHPAEKGMSPQKGIEF